MTDFLQEVSTTLAKLPGLLLRFLSKLHTNSEDDTAKQHHFRQNC